MILKTSFPNTPIGHVKESIWLCHKAQITLALWGHTGIGKSAIVADVAKIGRGETMMIGKNEHALPMGFVDFRCSGMEGPDVRGMPDRKDGRTVYLPQSSWPIGDMSAKEVETAVLDETQTEREHFMSLRAKGSNSPEVQEELVAAAYEWRRVMSLSRNKYRNRYQYGILFLDELNRAQDDVLQALFQTIYDRRTGDDIIPEGWGIIAACNYFSNEFVVNEFRDAAFLQRMCHINFPQGEQTYGDWVDWMMKTHGDYAGQIIQLTAANLDTLDNRSSDFGFEIQKSRRKWDMVARVQKAYDGIQIDGPTGSSRLSKDSLRMVVSGLVGPTLASTYFDYTCPVDPRSILRDGVDPYRSKLKELGRTELLSVTWGVLSYCKERYDDPQTMKTCVDLVEVLMQSDRIDKDVVIAFCRQIFGLNPDHVNQDYVFSNTELGMQMLKNGMLNNTFYTEFAKRADLVQAIASIGWTRE